MKGTPLAIAACLVLGACSSPAPRELARTDQPSTTTRPPVTTIELPTTLSTATATPTTTSPEQELSTESTGEEPPPTAREVIIDELVPHLGSTTDLNALISTVVRPLGRIATPTDSVVTELAIGLGSEREGDPEDPFTSDGVLTQVVVALHTSDGHTTAFNRMSGSLRSSGLFITDQVSVADRESATFRSAEGTLFDEVTVTSSVAPGGGSTVRVSASASVPPDSVQRFAEWTDDGLPLPPVGDQRTLVLLRRSGEGRLATSTLTLETTVSVENSTPQREANRLIDRISDHDSLEVGSVIEGDQPLEGDLRSVEFDRMTYSVVAGQTERVNLEGELEQIDVVEVRIQASTDPGS